MTKTLDLSSYTKLAVILSSPSGGGKSSLAAALKENNKEDYNISISTTTRAPREGEIDGVHYHFSSLKQFENALSNNEIIEYTKIYDNYYGTSISTIENYIKQNKTILFDIDYAGERAIKKIMPDHAVSIFIMAPNFQILRDRLESRGAGSEQQLKLRIESARREMLYAHNYDYVLINDDFNKTVGQIQKIIDAKQLKRDKELIIRKIQS